MAYIFYTFGGKIGVVSNHYVYFDPVSNKQIATGLHHTIVITKSGKIWDWGYNRYGQLGNNSITSVRTPVAILGATKTFCKIDGGEDHTIAIDKNGKIWGWGYNYYGQLGDNTKTSRLTPVAVLGATKTFCQIATGNLFSLGIDKNGKGWGWGNAGFGQLAGNSYTWQSTPVAMAGTTKTFCQIAAGGAHGLGIDKNGKTWGWGYNGKGMVGDNTTITRLTPVEILGTTKTFCSIAGGDSFTIALDKNGKAWGWGSNYQGQLGINAARAGSSKSTPVAVLGAAKTFCQVTTGQQHAMALDKNGKAWGWGYNQQGQLGDITTTNRCTPVAVRGTTKTFCQISGGRSHTIAIDKNGKVWGWGYNNYGQVGNNSTTNCCTPVMITTL